MIKRIASKSEKRLIIEGIVNGKSACFLLDSGASVGIMDYDQRKNYDLKIGRKYAGTLIGAGGEMRNVKHVDTFAEFEGKLIPQFLLADISGVVESIERETGIKILGIVSLPQMKIVGLGVDANSNEIIVEDNIE